MSGTKPEERLLPIMRFGGGDDVGGLSCDERGRGRACSGGGCYGDDTVSV